MGWVLWEVKNSQLEVQKQTIWESFWRIFFVYSVRTIKEIHRLGKLPRFFPTRKWNKTASKWRLKKESKRKLVIARDIKIKRHFRNKTKRKITLIFRTGKPHKVTIIIQKYTQRWKRVHARKRWNNATDNLLKGKLDW